MRGSGTAKTGTARAELRATPFGKAFATADLHKLVFAPEEFLFLLF